MPLKVAIVQAAAATGTPTFTQDFTDSNAGFSSDVKAAIFIGSSATANHTDTADAYLAVGFGCVSGTGEWCHMVMTDNGATPNEDANLGVDSQIYAHLSNTAARNGDANFNSFLSNGIRIDWTDQSIGELIAAVLLGGDIEASVVSEVFTNTGPPETIDIPHGLGGAPEVIFQISPSTGGDPGTNSLGIMGLGFWAASAQSAFAIGLNASTTQASNARVLSAASGGQHATGGGTMSYTTTITAVDATNVSVQTDALAGTDRVILLCLRGTAGAIVAKTGVFDTPTSTGVASVITGMSAAPQALFCIPTRLTSVDASATNDSAGCLGFIAAVNNAGAGTQYGGATSTMDDGSMPVDASHETTNSQALRILGVTGSADVEATVDAWASGGVDLNFLNINASAFKIPYLALGIASATTARGRMMMTGIG